MLTHKKSLKLSNRLSRFLFFLLLLNCFSSFSQNIHKADSLLHVLQHTNVSKEEQSILLESIAFYHPKLDTALLLVKQSLEVAIEIKDPILQAGAWEGIGLIEQQLGNSDQSLNATFKALRIYESLNLTERMAASYAQIASYYLSDTNYPIAISYLKKTKDIYSQSENTSNLALTIINLGESHRLANHLDSAVTNFQQALRINKTIKNKTIQGYSLGNLGMVYSTQNKYIIAKKNLNEAITIFSDLKNYYSTSVYLAELGEIYAKEKEWNLSEEKFLEALKMAKQNGLKEQIRDFSAMLVSFYEDQQMHKKALSYQKLYQVYQDSLVNKNNIQKIEQLKSGYEIDKRESEIGLLNTINTNQKRTVILLIIGSLLLLLFVSLLYFGNKKIKKTNQILSSQKNIITKREQEKALLLRELNHRVKNNLQMISSLLNLQSHELTGHPAKEAIMSGKYRVEALSLVHRKLYQEGLDTKIRVKEYIEELVLGLFHGYDAKFKPDFEIDDISINIDMAIPLALIINELIINSLKYAYKNIDHPILKIVMSQKSNDSLDVQIIDNGIGFTAIKNKKNSFGIKLITSLIEQLEGSIEKLNNKGTHWRMNIKIA